MAILLYLHPIFNKFKSIFELDTDNSQVGYSSSKSNAWSNI